ncbi:monovalent cation:proton antiporter-2 (CPA2) family protein [Shewanella submarina]|uniref:Monovalent cation:proton antiporter-2 (CPA2) family protein n=1 Tax=Shewanella submarina TaxID=2016376 RepID=A0ABV7GAZ3_9GAMM|nr:monovalent cation:proton antiporter-2 (CPA2) family protein [Shewanella submarina]MCL1037768.1 monovalent cation:proton antiporter-2 (CPA2) family protein [Shewanella submarina]
MTAYFLQAFIYLCAAVIAVPLAKRLGLGSVLGYLAAGVIIGPVIGLVGQETVAIQHFAEFGVVMMLFLVGLELNPKSLWDMRHKLIGLGGLQMGLTTAAITLIAVALGQTFTVALSIGLIFSLSSTAIVLQTFNEKGLNRTEGGRTAFSVLLFQDIAVIPILALLPLLALPELVAQAQLQAAEAASHSEHWNLVAELPGWVYAIVIVLTITGLVTAGHYLSRPLFRYVAESGLREIFTATALMLVIGIAALMSLIGLSPALGTFLAGLVLANSEFRHELESNIEPFKGLLLGLFFITVGAGIDFSVLWQDFGAIIGLTLGVILIKALVLLCLTIIFRVKYSDRWLFSLSLAQAGEFGFVLLNYSQQNHVLPTDLSQMLALVVTFSMFLTPALFIFFDKVILPRYEAEAEQRDADDIQDQASVIIAGIGRFGQIVNRMLTANNIRTVILDHQPSQIDLMRQIKVKGYFGDATRPDLLHTAGIEAAKLLVIAIDDKDRAVELVTYVKHHYPQVKVLARAYDRGHLYALQLAGADMVISETFLSAVQMGTEALKVVGMPAPKADMMRDAFVRREQQSKEVLYQTWKAGADDNRFSNTHYRDLFLQLEETMKQAMEDEKASYRKAQQQQDLPRCDLE